MWLLTLPEVLPKHFACNCNPYNRQSLLQVDEEIDVEERHPQLRNSDNQAGPAGASSLPKDSLSSELASSEQRQGPPKVDLYRETGRYKAPWMWDGYSPSPAATMEQSYSDGAEDSEAIRGRGSSSRQLSSRLDRDMPLFTGPALSSWQGKQKQRYSHGQQQHGQRFEYDHEYDYPARHRGDLTPAHPRFQQQHGPGTVGDDSEMGPPGFIPGPQSSGWVSREHRLSSNPIASQQQQEDNDSEAAPPGFPLAPQSNGWSPRPSSNAAALEPHDNGTRPPGFPATPTSSAAARRTQQQRRNGHRGQPTR